MSAIRGEYWITDIGEILPVDDDNNHTQEAARHAISMLFDLALNDPIAKVLMSSVGEQEHYDGDVIALREALLNASDELARQPKYAELREDLDLCLIRAGVTESTLAALWSQGVDPRIWAMEECGWIAVKGPIVLHGMTPARLRLLQEALWDIVMMENPEEIDLEVTQMEFTIADTKADVRYHASLASLDDGLYPVPLGLAAALPGR